MTVPVPAAPLTVTFTLYDPDAMSQSRPAKELSDPFTGVASSPAGAPFVPARQYTGRTTTRVTPGSATLHEYLGDPRHDLRRLDRDVDGVRPRRAAEEHVGAADVGGQHDHHRERGSDAQGDDE